MDLASYKIKPNDLTVKERHRVQPGRIGHLHAYFIRQSEADLMRPLEDWIRAQIIITSSMEDIPHCNSFLYIN